jgi:hypothetical protein
MFIEMNNELHVRRGRMCWFPNPFYPEISGCDLSEVVEKGQK